MSSSPWQAPLHADDQVAGHPHRPQPMLQRPATVMAARPATASTPHTLILHPRTAPARTILAMTRASQRAMTPPDMQMRRAEVHR